MQDLIAAIDKHFMFYTILRYPFPLFYILFAFCSVCN